MFLRRFRPLPFVLLGGTLAASLVPVVTSTAAAPPVRDVVVSGAGISTWPTYSPDADRFAIGTAGTSTGVVTVTATTTDPDGEITVNGVPLNGSSAEVTDLEVGDEVNVQISDSAGTSNQSWIYLPARFPTLTTASAGTPTPGYVFLGLISYLASPLETVIDASGVPVHVQDIRGQDLKPSGSGYVVARSAAGGGDAIVELDDRFREVARHQLVGIPQSTDGHDFEVLPDGSVLMMGYHLAARDDSTWNDAVIQIVDPDGNKTFEWNSKDHIDPADAYVAPPTFGDGYADYAHINSLQMVGDDNDVLASFRNLSQIRLIATQDHDGHRAGDTIWTFGGADNDFVITDGEGGADGGPCAQHMARLLPDGRLTLFDNGSRLDGAAALGGQTADMCADPADPEGPRIARPLSRVTEYDVDLSSPGGPTADLVWSYSYPNRYAAFAGGQQRLDNENTLIGWSQATDASGSGEAQPIATEVTRDGSEVWSVSTNGWFTYRATKGDAPDRTDPEIVLSTPVDGATYDEGDSVPVAYSCSDRGGSNLASCAGTVGNGHDAPMTLGEHTISVTATDRAGNETSRSLTYSVVAAPTPPPTTWQPDVRIRLAGGSWHGQGDTGSATSQSVTAKLTKKGQKKKRSVDIWIRNTGSVADRFVLAGRKGDRKFLVKYRSAGHSVTGAMTDGSLTTPRLAPGATYKVRGVVTRTPLAQRGDERRINVVARSRDHRSHKDAVSVQLRAIR